MAKVTISTSYEGDTLADALAKAARALGEAADQAAQGTVPYVDGVTCEGEPSVANPSGARAEAILAGDVERDEAIDGPAEAEVQT